MSRAQEGGEDGFGPQGPSPPEPDAQRRLKIPGTASELLIVTRADAGEGLGDERAETVSGAMSGLGSGSSTLGKERARNTVAPPCNSEKHLLRLCRQSSAGKIDCGLRPVAFS